MHPHDHSHQLLSAERHQHSRAHRWNRPVHHIGEGLIQGHGQSNVAVQSHLSSLATATPLRCLPPAASQANPRLALTPFTRYSSSL